MFEQLKDQALAIHQAAEAAERAVKADERFSDAGKREKLQEIEADRLRKVEALQGEARQEIELKRKIVSGKLARMRTEAFNSKREALGDAVITRVYERQIKALPVEALGDFFDQTTEGFERELARELIRIELAERGDLGQAHAYLLDQLDDTPAGMRTLEAQERELTRSDDVVKALDLKAYRADFAANLGVAYEFVDLQ